MPGKVVSLRLEAGLLGRIDARAAELGKSRSAFLEWAAENALDDAVRGVPDVPAEDPKPEPSAPADQWHVWAMERQRKLNADKDRRRG